MLLHLLLLGTIGVLSSNGTTSNDCACIGVTNQNGFGAADCTSTWLDQQWCYVDFDSSCDDLMDSTSMPDYKWSFQACRNQCTCAGVSSTSGNGNDDCSSIYAERQWCYVENDSTCPDAAESSQMENHKWSFAACENQCTCAGVVNTGGNGGAECDSEWQGSMWCYVDINSTCPDILESSHMAPDYGWSFAACGGGFEETTRPPVVPLALHNYSNVTMLGSLTFPYLMGNAHVSGVPEPYNATCVEDCCFDCDTWETKLNDVWGWTSADGRQIAVAGTPDRTVIVDVTNGSDPRQLGFLPQITSNVAIWKDVKVWESTVFIGSESKGFGIQVLDLQKVVDAEDVPRVFMPDQVFCNDSAFHSHNLVINDNAPILYTVDTNLCNTLARIPFTITSDGEVVLETDIPDASCIGGEITEVHDAQCVIYNGPDQRFLGEEICFLNTGYQASVAIYSWTTNTVLGHLNYTDAKFSHQSWLTEDSAYLFHGDELDVGNTRTSIFDVRDLTNITELAPYIAPTNFVDHNQYVVGRLVYQANYAGGLVILAHDNQGNAERVGYYDYSWVEQDQMMGAWGVYPFFSSGEFAAGKKIVLTGYEGMQVFEIDEELECYLDDTCDATNEPTMMPTVLQEDIEDEESGTASTFSTFTMAVIVAVMAVPF